MKVTVKWNLCILCVIDIICLHLIYKLAFPVIHVFKSFSFISEIRRSWRCIIKRRCRSISGNSSSSPDIGILEAPSETVSAHCCIQQMKRSTSGRICCPSSTSVGALVSSYKAPRPLWLRHTCGRSSSSKPQCACIR